MVDHTDNFYDSKLRVAFTSPLQLELPVLDLGTLHLKKHIDKYYILHTQNAPSIDCGTLYKTSYLPILSRQCDVA